MLNNASSKVPPQRQPSLTTASIFEKRSSGPSRRGKGRLGWYGLPKQMSATSASSTSRLLERDEDGGPRGFIIEEEEEGGRRRRSVAAGGGRKGSASASTNHLDRLKMAMAAPLLKSRQSSTASASGAGGGGGGGGGVSTSSSTSKMRKQYSNLFPCPMVKTLDMDSPEGSLSSLGIVSGLNPHHVGPFASSTSAALARRGVVGGGGAATAAARAAAAARMRAQRQAYRSARSVQSQHSYLDVPILITEDGTVVAPPGSGFSSGSGVGVYGVGGVGAMGVGVGGGANSAVTLGGPDAGVIVGPEDIRLARSGPPSASRMGSSAWARQTSLPTYSVQHHFLQAALLDQQVWNQISVCPFPL